MKNEYGDGRIKVIMVNQGHAEIYFDFTELYSEDDLSRIIEDVKNRSQGKIYVDNSLRAYGMMTVRGNIAMIHPGDFTLEKAVEYICEEIALDMSDYNYWES